MMHADLWLSDAVVCHVQVPVDLHCVLDLVEFGLPLEKKVPMVSSAFLWCKVGVPARGELQGA